MDVSEAFVSVENVTIKSNATVYPNPFESDLSVNFSVAKSEKVKISLFDIQGRQLRVLLDSKLSAGDYNYDFNLKAESLDSKVYILRIEMNQRVLMKRVVKM